MSSLGIGSQWIRLDEKFYIATSPDKVECFGKHAGLVWRVVYERNGKL